MSAVEKLKPEAPPKPTQMGDLKPTGVYVTTSTQLGPITAATVLLNQPREGYVPDRLEFMPTGVLVHWRNSKAERGMNLIPWGNIRSVKVEQ